MAENKDKVKLEDTFSADEAAVKTTSENKEEKAAVREEVLGKVEADLATYKNKAEEAESKLATTISQYIRLQADFENFRRRSRENEAKLSIARKLLQKLRIVGLFERRGQRVVRLLGAVEIALECRELILRRFDLRSEVNELHPHERNQDRDDKHREKTGVPSPFFDLCCHAAVPPFSGFGAVQNGRCAHTTLL